MMKRSSQLLLALLALSLWSFPAQAQSSGTWTLMHAAPVAQAGPGAAVLPSGKVLYANGDGSGNAQIFDASANSWSPTGSMKVKRNGPVVALRLASGKVLVAGGWIYQVVGGKRTALGDTSAELYDPATGTFSLTGSMKTGRAGGTITLLPNGKVLVTGGWSINAIPTNPRYANSTNGADLYDPASGTWSAAAPMPMALAGHTATLLPSGRVLVTGGINYYVRINAQASLYDPAANTWTVHRLHDHQPLIPQRGAPAERESSGSQPSRRSLRPGHRRLHRYRRRKLHGLSHVLAAERKGPAPGL